jgi:hypothetical protein
MDAEKSEDAYKADVRPSTLSNIADGAIPIVATAAKGSSLILAGEMAETAKQNVEKP